ncbi:MAG: hypothetical protein GY851_20695 [bacterium]|nr:hypothetical protein [bacterium]
MKYFKASQPVPGKGDAWVYYECTDEEAVVRQLTVIPATGESERISDPVVKKLYRREMLQEATEQEFQGHWGSGS